MLLVLLIDIEIAKEKVRVGDVDAAIDIARGIVDHQFQVDEMVYRGQATAVLVEALLSRGGDGDQQEAAAAMDRLAAAPTAPGFVFHDLLLLRLRALLAQAHGDGTGYRDYRDRYRDMAKTLGFEGHIAWAEAMP
jgi:adenylate cyclase